MVDMPTLGNGDLLTILERIETNYTFPFDKRECIGVGAHNFIT
jgi:hypothetical protein